MILSEFLIVSIIVIKAKHDSVTALRTGLGMASAKVNYLWLLQR